MLWWEFLATAHRHDQLIQITQRVSVSLSKVTFKLTITVGVRHGQKESKAWMMYSLQNLGEGQNTTLKIHTEAQL